MSIVNLKDYKTAKKLTQDLNEILRVMNTAKKELKPYMRYHHVRMVLENMVRNSDVLTVHLHKQLRVLEEAKKSSSFEELEEAKKVSLPINEKDDDG